MLDGFATPEELGVSEMNFKKAVKESNKRIRVKIQKQQEEKYLTHEEILEIGQQREEENALLEKQQNEETK